MAEFDTLPPEQITAIESIRGEVVVVHPSMHPLPFIGWERPNPDQLPPQIVDLPPEDMTIRALDLPEELPTSERHYTMSRLDRIMVSLGAVAWLTSFGIDATSNNDQGLERATFLTGVAAFLPVISSYINRRHMKRAANEN